MQGWTVESEGQNVFLAGDKGGGRWKGQTCYGWSWDLEYFEGSIDYDALIEYVGESS